jgi:hypothetical protein
MVLSRGMAVPAMQSSALGASYPPLQIGATHRLDHSKLVPPTDWMINPLFMVYFPPIGATHRLGFTLVVDFPPIGATHRLGFTPRWGVMC